VQPQAGAVPQWTAQQGIGPTGGAPGFGHPGIAQPGQGSLHAYRPARRKPDRAEVPASVMNALRLMYIGGAATVVSVVVSTLATIHLSSLAGPSPYTTAQNAAYDAEGLVALFGLFGGVLGVIMWFVLTIPVRRGRKWGAVVGTVLFGIQTISMLFLLVGATGAPMVKVFSVIVWGLGLAATVILWGRPARAFYQQFR
jgi:hypothetical protein